MAERLAAIEGELAAQGLRCGIVASRFNDFVVDRLLDAAVDTLLGHGAAPGDVLVVRVPGALEIPLALRRLAAAGRCDAFVALGCVVRGATPHFDYVCSEASAGIMRVGLDFDVPVGFGVLTCETVEQAIERAGGKAGNKGADAAQAALRMASVLRRLDT